MTFSEWLSTPFFLSVVVGLLLRKHLYGLQAPNGYNNTLTRGEAVRYQTVIATALKGCNITHNNKC